MMILNLFLLLTAFRRASASPAPVPEPQGVYAVLKPSAPKPAGCIDTYDKDFTLFPSPIQGTGPPAIRPVGTSCDGPTSLSCNLRSSVLFDVQGRIGSIVDNHQFQFDGPPAQAGAIFTGGFSICHGSYLVLGKQHVFYSCNSGSFDNVYDEPIGDHCRPVNLYISHVVEC